MHSRSLPLGHANITMTARYAHALEDGKIDAVRRLESKTPIQLDPTAAPDAKTAVLEVGTKPSRINAVGV